MNSFTHNHRTQAASIIIITDEHKMSWEDIVTEARNISSKDAFMEPIMEKFVLQHDNFSAALVSMLAQQFAGTVGEENWNSLFASVHCISSSMCCLEEYEPGKGSLAVIGLTDLVAIKERDPATSNLVSPFLYFKGYKALQAHRIAHVRNIYSACRLVLLRQLRCCGEMIAAKRHAQYNHDALNCSVWTFIRPPQLDLV